MVVSRLFPNFVTQSKKMPIQPKFSEELLSVLERMRSASVVADALYSLATDGEDSVDFQTDEDGNPSVDYLSISSEDPLKISYLTPDRVARLLTVTHGNTRPLWTSSRRYHARPTVVASRVLKSIPPKDLEVFNNIFRAVAGVVKFEFKVVSGESIRHWYHDGTYVRNCGGSLGASCMKHSVCQELLDLYVDNNEVISMLIMVDKNNMLLGRALLWEFEDLAGSGRVRLMDRIYTANDEELPHHFKVWAQENGYLFKPVQKWNNSLDFVENGQTVKKRLSVKLNHYRYDKYPYLDTFKFLNGRSGVVSNHLTPGCTKTLCCADGSAQRSDWLSEDFLDGLYHPTGEMAPITYDTESLNVTRPLRLTHGSNVRYSEVNETHILKSHCTQDPILGDYLFVGEYAHLNNKKRMVELAKLRARMDFQTYVSLACKHMTFTQVMASHDQLREEWRGNPESLDQAVASYFA